LSKSTLTSVYQKSAKVEILAKALEQRDTKINAKGLLGSALSFIVQAAFEKSDLPFLLLFNDKEEAAYHLNDLEQLINNQDVLFYPGSYRRPYQIE
jgi:transcription-repair coupling factor (superfamily II helicase)